MSGSAFFQSEKILIGAFRLACVAGERIGAGQTKVRQSAQRKIHHDAAVIEVDGSHAAIMAHVTMLVICYLSSGMRGQREHPSAGASRISVNSGRTQRGAMAPIPGRDWLCWSFSDPLAVSDREGSRRNSLYGLCG